MEKRGQHYVWPEKPNISWIAIENCICEIEEPTLMSNRLQYGVDTSKVAGLIPQAQSVSFK